MSQGPITAKYHLRSLYRSLLRELPPQQLGPISKTLSSSSSSPPPLRHRLRSTFTSPSIHSPPNSSVLLRQRQEAEQFLQYIRAQRVYTTLLERYNPGIRVDEEDGERERVRLTARRVGMEMPREWYERKKGGGGHGSR